MKTDGHHAAPPDPVRRKVLQGLAGTSAAVLVFNRALAALSQNAGKVTPDMVRQAEWIAGLSFTEEERSLMLASLTETAQGYEQLRKVPLDNATPPALGFHPIVRPHLETTSPTGPPSLPSVKPNVSLQPQELAFATISELAGLLRARKISPLELVRTCFQRIEKLDPTLKAIVTPTRELAEKQAQAAEVKFREKSAPGPLTGIPWGAKDLIAVPGYPTTWGSPIYKTQVRAEQATVAQKLEQAGAALVAKTSVGELALGDVWFGGTTKNPWKPDQGSSGSSAGSAAGVAAGLFTFGIGTETLGSIVSPSTRCGVTGLRPTFGRVSRHGVMALAWSMDKVGVLARSAADCAYVFASIHGKDPLDPSSQDAPFGFPSVKQLQSLRVGFVEALFEDPKVDSGDTTVTPAQKAQIAEQLEFDRRTLEVLRRLGVKLKPIKLPQTIPLAAMYSILTAEAATAFDELVRTGTVKQMVQQTAHSWPNTLRQGQLIPAVEYIRANRVRTLLMQEMEAAVKEVDVYVCPTYGGSNLLITNLTGHPALALPNGFRTSNGTPTSITFNGRLWEETKLLALGMAYQQATDFHQKRPPFALQ
ncbi:MAG: amidase [Blastocatellia bacterium]|nr:amidase [Blastocatellia bacterium]